MGDTGLENVLRDFILQHMVGRAGEGGHNIEKAIRSVVRDELRLAWLEGKLMPVVWIDGSIAEHRFHEIMSDRTANPIDTTSSADTPARVITWTEEAWEKKQTPVNKGLDVMDQDI